MLELSAVYMNKLAAQIQFVSALLGGFSLTVLVLLFDKSEGRSGRLMLNIFRLSILSTSAFIVTIFAMTQILLMTTEGFPFPVTSEDIHLPRVVGMLCFLLGIISVLSIIALLGWTKSRALGVFSTVVSGLALVFILIMIL